MRAGGAQTRSHRTNLSKLPSGRLSPACRAARLSSSVQADVMAESCALWRESSSALQLGVGNIIAHFFSPFGPALASRQRPCGVSRSCPARTSSQQPAAGSPALLRTERTKGSAITRPWLHASQQCTFSITCIALVSESARIAHVLYISEDGAVVPPPKDRPCPLRSLFQPGTPHSVLLSPPLQPDKLTGLQAMASLALGRRLCERTLVLSSPHAWIWILVLSFAGRKMRSHTHLLSHCWTTH